MSSQIHCKGNTFFCYKQGIKNEIIKKLLFNLYDLSAIINPHNYIKIISRSLISV